MTAKPWNVILGAEIVGRLTGYATREEAVRAARKLARDHGSLPFEIVYRAPTPRRCPPSPVSGEE